MVAKLVQEPLQHARLPQQGLLHAGANYALCNLGGHIQKPWLSLTPGGVFDHLLK